MVALRSQGDVCVQSWTSILRALSVLMAIPPRPEKPKCRCVSNRKADVTVARASTELPHEDESLALFEIENVKFFQNLFFLFLFC